MITWLPAIVSIKEGLSMKYKCFRFKSLSSPILNVGKKLEDGIIKIINRFPILWIILLSKYFIDYILKNIRVGLRSVNSILGIIGILSSIVVLYWPKLQLPDSADFKLFVNNHPFELYDTIYKDRFWFEKVYTVSSFCFLFITRVVNLK